MLYAVFYDVVLGAALVIVAVGAGVVAVSAARQQKTGPHAAATTRANTFFIVIPSNCFYLTSLRGR